MAVFVTATVMWLSHILFTVFASVTLHDLQLGEQKNG